MEPNAETRAEIICRICLSEAVQMRPLSDKMDGDSRTLFEVLSFVANINVSSDTKYPQHICDDCFSLLRKSDEFKKKCLSSDSVLKDKLDADKASRSPTEIKVKAIKPGVEPYQCTLCFEKFASCAYLESHVLLVHYSVKEMSKEFDNYSNVALSAECDDSVSLNKPYEVKEENTDLGTEFTDYFEVDNFTEPDYKQEDKTVECTCGCFFTSEDDLKKHVKTCADFFTRLKKPQTQECYKCERTFTSTKTLRRHERKVHNDSMKEIYHCTTCMRSFLRKSSYVSHMKMHETKDHLKFICNTCKREFQHQAHLDNHILAVHTREKGYSCEICSVNFTTLECLNIHKATHKNEKKHRCKLCNKAFQMMSTLTEHMRTHTGERPHLCSICGRGFSQKNNLEQHVRRHKGLKPFKCETCERSFVSKGELVAHARKHSGAHPFVCDDCGKGFTTSSSLVKHRRIHTGERPYGCDLCSMRFSASGTLKNHRRTHTGEKPYQCSHCEKAFVQRQDLVSHIRCHTGERPYVCANCGQAFRKASALKTHVKIHVKDGTAGLTLTTFQDVNSLLTHFAGCVLIPGIFEANNSVLSSNAVTGLS